MPNCIRPRLTGMDRLTGKMAARRCGRHVIGAFSDMAQIAHGRVVGARNEAAEEGLQIVLDVRIRVFLDQQGTGRVTYEQREDAVALNPVRDLPGELVETGPAGLDREHALHGAPPLSPFLQSGGARGARPSKQTAQSQGRYF